MNLEDCGAEFEQRNCPVCEGQGEVLGFLGNRAWYKCRDCGIEFNILIDKLGTVYTEAKE